MSSLSLWLFAMIASTLVFAICGLSVKSVNKKRLQETLELTGKQRVMKFEIKLNKNLRKFAPGFDLRTFSSNPDVLPLRHSGIDNEKGNNTSVNYNLKLLEDLIMVRRIDKFSRPVQHHKDTVYIQSSLYIHDILALDSKTETFSINGIMKHEWQDYNLTWNPEKYGGLNSFQIPDFYVWKPDFILLNSVNLQQSGIGSFRRTPLEVNSSGWIVWTPPATFHSRCPMDLTLFPYDDHVCDLWFTSLTHNSDQLDISFGTDSLTDDMVNEEMILSLATRHREWDIKATWKTVGTWQDKRLPSYKYLRYSIHLRRKAAYYHVSLVLPCVVALGLTLVTFWLPSVSGHKLLLGGVNTLMIEYLLVHQYFVIPRPGRYLPTIVVFTGVTMALSGISLVVAVITNTLSRMGTAPVPVLLVRLLNGIIGQILCLTPLRRKVLSESKEDIADNDHNAEDSSLNLSRVGIHHTLCVDWVLVATAIDRICFIIYCLSTIVILAVIL